MFHWFDYFVCGLMLVVDFLYAVLHAGHGKIQLHSLKCQLLLHMVTVSAIHLKHFEIFLIPLSITETAFLT